MMAMDGVTFVFPGADIFFLSTSLSSAFAFTRRADFPSSSSKLLFSPSGFAAFSLSPAFLPTVDYVKAR